MILRCFLHGPGIGDGDLDLELALGLGRLGSGSPASSLTETDASDSRSSVLINGFPSSGIWPGWLDPPSRNQTRSSESRQPRMASIKSGRRDLNPRHPRWQRGALPLSYSRMSQQNQEMRPTPSEACQRPSSVRNQNQYSAATRELQAVFGKASIEVQIRLGFPFAYRAPRR